MADGFLGRWAKRKNDVLQGKPLEEPAPATSVAPASSPASALAKVGTAPPGSASEQPAAEQPAPLTLDDVQDLTKDSDFKPFMNKAVEPGVRNAAMKKLFADPHFNVMDRMDIYIDDYSQPDPIPAAMLRQMVSAKFLKLFDDEEEEQKAAEAQGVQGNPSALADVSGLASQDAEDEINSITANASSLPSDDNAHPLSAPAEPDFHQDNHAHSDLRLQPDHAAESPDLGRSTA